MKILTLFSSMVVGMMFLQSMGLPIEKELYRVKRKGELEGENEDGYGGRKNLATSFSNRKTRSIKEEKRTEEDGEIRRRRRFQMERIDQRQGESKTFLNKMAAISSRSEREDKDITARGLERFKNPKLDVKGDKQPAKRSTNGYQDESDVSASGMWMPDSTAEAILSSKVDSKRSVNSLESIVAALSAISRVSPEGDDDDYDGSASAAWDISGSVVEPLHHNENLPKFFSAAATNSDVADVVTSGSGSNSGKVESNLASDLEEAAEKHDDRQSSNSEKYTAFSGSGMASTEEKNDSLTVKRRHALEEYLGVPDAIYRSKRNKEVNKHDDQLARYFRNIKTVIATEEQSQVSKLVNDKKTESDVNQKVSANGEGANGPSGLSDDNSGLSGLNLVRRFYRDQEMEETGQPKVSLPSVQIVTKGTIPDNNGISKISSNPINTAPETKSKVPESTTHSHDIFEPRVIRKKQIAKAHVTIFEEPAVYSHRVEKQMDSSDGGMNGDDSEEPAIEIHERDIREDGYVGCYADQTPDRDLPFAVSVTDITPISCRTSCRENRHAYAALQYGYLCRCGDTYGKYSKLAEEQCSTPCKGDRTKICGGFFRSSIYATDGVTEPTHGDFIHIENVQPLNAALLNPGATNYPPPAVQNNIHPMASYPSLLVVQPPQSPLAQSGPVVHFAQPVQPPTYFVPDEPKLTIHSETPLHVSSPSTVIAEVKAKVITVPYRYPAMIPDVVGNLGQVKKSTIARPPKPHPQGAHGSQIMYLHRQHDIVSEPKPEPEPLPNIEVSSGTKTYTGSIKLKQSWLDSLHDRKSPEFMILSGNLEQALKKMFASNPNFIKATVLGFREGIVKHNPATIRKVIAPFSLTFKEDSTGVEDMLKKHVLSSGRLFDMPVYKQSLRIQEYHAPLAKPLEAKIIQERIQPRKGVHMDSKRSNVVDPKLPYTLEFFLMKDLGKKKRSEQAHTA